MKCESGTQMSVSQCHDTPATVANANQEFVNQGESIPGSMHRGGAANVTVPSLSQMFCCTHVAFNENSDKDSVQSFGRTPIKCL